MASYIEESLTKGEKVIYDGKISLWSLVPYIFFGLITLMIPNLYGMGLILFWALAIIRYTTTELTVTNKRIVAKSGFISRQTMELNLSRAESIQVKQDVLGRIFNYGSLIISGAGNPQAPIAGISNPMAFRRMVLEAQEQMTESKSMKVAEKVRDISRDPQAVETKKCSSCAETIKQEAKICRFCGNEQPAQRYVIS